MGDEAAGSNIPVQVERRKHPRYQFCEELLIYREDGSSYPATTAEISLRGLSAASPGILRPGEEVRLSAIVGEQVKAVVRRKVGRMYGFEFVSVAPKFVEAIDTLCRGLVLFRGLSEAQASQR